MAVPPPKSSSTLTCPTCSHSWANHSLTPDDSGVADKGTLDCSECDCSQPWPPPPPPDAPPPIRL